MCVQQLGDTLTSMGRHGVLAATLLRQRSTGSATTPEKESDLRDMIKIPLLSSFIWESHSFSQLTLGEGVVVVRGDYAH